RELTRAIRCRSTPLPSLLSAPHTRTMHTLCLRVALPIFDDPDGVAVVAEVATAEGWSFAGHALGAPLEHFASLDGPAQDAFLGSGNTLYSLALTVDERLRGMGLGSALKREQLKAAREMTAVDGSSRYKFVSGRNAVGHADPMLELNRTLGAHVVAVHTGQYPPLAAST